MLTINKSKRRTTSTITQALSAMASGLQDVKLSPTLGTITSSMESMDSVQTRTLTTATTNLDSVLIGVIRNAGLFADESNELALLSATASADASAYGALLATDPQSFIQQEVTPTISSSATHKVIGAVGDGLRFRKLAQESYDNKDIDRMVEYSAVYNLFAPNPGQFVSANFPVITIDPATTGLEITCDLLYVQTDAIRKISGDLTDFNRRSLTHATVDPSILQPDVTRIIPIVRPESVDKFADPADLPVRSIVYNEIPMDTAPLLFGKEHDLLALSQDDRLVTRGVMGLTDQLDVDVQLTGVYIKVGDDVIHLSTKGITTSRFVVSQQEATTGMNLNFITDHLLIDKRVTDVADAPLVTLAAITGSDLKVRLRVEASGRTDVDEATTVVHANTIRVTSIYDATGEELDLTVAPAAAVVALFETAEFLGYDLYATRSNVNLRQRGHIIGSSKYTEEYFVGLGSPLTSIRPINTNDDSDLRGLIAASHIRMTGDAVNKLVETAEILSQITTTGVDDYPDILGIGRLYVKPTFIPEYVDVATQVSTQNSFETIRDISALLVNIIKDTAARMFVESGMAGAKSVLNPVGNVKTTVVVSTSSYIASYLTSPGVNVELEDKLFKYMIVHDANSQLYGKMYLTFHQIDDQRNTAPNVLSFGCMPYVPDVVLNLNITRDGQPNRELCVHPRYKAIVLSPIMGLINVRNITNALGKSCMCIVDQVPDSIGTEWSV